MRTRHRLLHALLVVLVLVLATSAHAEPIRLSTTGNATLGFPSVAFERDTVVELQTSTGSVTVVFDERSFPNSENVDAVHVLPDGRVVLSTAAQATLGSPALTFEDGDLVVYDTAADTATLLFAEAEHFAGDADVDAVSVRPDGTLVLSTRAAAVIGTPPLAFADGDLIAYDPVTKTAGVLLPETVFAGDENVDAVHVHPDGRLVLSVERDSGAVLGGLTFRDGDLVEYDPVLDVATLVLSETAFGADEDVDAVHLGCGNATVESDEECDEGGATPTCHGDCTLPICGDGILDPHLGEACDDGGESASCDGDCTAAACGDGTVNPTAGEQCDDAGESATCDPDCTAAVCGDGTVNPTAGEQCDDAGESAGCDVDCTLAVCGDGTTNATRGESCDDGNTADGDCCAAACVLDPAGTPCPDDGDVCTPVDACDGAGTCRHPATPRTGCRTSVRPGRGLLLVKDKAPDAKDRLVWKWLKGEATALADFGAPLATDAYTLCAYDESGVTPTVAFRATAPAGGICLGGRPCWRAKGSGYRYVDKELTPDGVMKLDLRTGLTPGKAKIVLKGKGDLLGLPPLPAPLPLRLQLVGSHGACWEARFSAAGVRRNEATQLKVKSD